MPDNAAYGERMETYWSLSAALEPWCMVMPKTVEGVSAAMKTIVKNKCPFGIRGGGHGTHALANSLEEGVTIDMGKQKVHMMPSFFPPSPLPPIHPLFVCSAGYNTA